MMLLEGFLLRPSLIYIFFGGGGGCINASKKVKSSDFFFYFLSITSILSNLSSKGLLFV